MSRQHGKTSSGHSVWSKKPIMGLGWFKFKKEKKKAEKEKITHWKEENQRKQDLDTIQDCMCTVRWNKMSCACAGLSEPGAEGSNGLSSWWCWFIWFMENQCSPCSKCGSYQGSTFASTNSKQSWSLGSPQEASPLLGAQSTGKSFHGRDSVLFFPLPCL